MIDPGNACQSERYTLLRPSGPNSPVRFESSTDRFANNPELGGNFQAWDTSSGRIRNNPKLVLKVPTSCKPGNDVLEGHWRLLSGGFILAGIGLRELLVTVSSISLGP